MKKILMGMGILLVLHTFATENPEPFQKIGQVGLPAQIPCVPPARNLKVLTQEFLVQEPSKIMEMAQMGLDCFYNTGESAFDYFAKVKGYVPGVALSHETAKRIFELFFKKNFLMLEEEGTVVGFAVCMVEGSETKIGNVCIKKDQQGKGLGKFLMKEIFKNPSCRREGTKGFSLDVLGKNEKALALYRKLGFTIDAARTQSLGKWSDDYVMILPDPQVKNLDQEILKENLNFLAP